MHDDYSAAAVKPREPSSKGSAVLTGPAALPNRHDAAGEPELSMENVGRPKTGWILGLLAAAFCAMGVMLYAGWMPLARREKALTAESELVKGAAPRVSVISPKPSAPASEILLPGEIQALRETSLYARTSGYVKRWLVDMGDNVKAGQLLAEIESPEVDMQVQHAQSALEQTEAALAQSQAAVDQAKAMADQSQAALEQARAQLANGEASAELADLTKVRYVSLRGTGGVSEQDISDKETAAKVAHTVVAANAAGVGSAKAAVNSAKAAIAAAEAALNASRANVNAAKAAMRELEVMKSFELVTAPFDGTITSRQAEVGALVTAGSGSGAQQLFHVACSDPVRVFVDVPQMYAPSIKIGQQMQLLVREFPGAKYSGTVTRTARSIDTAGRTLKTEMQVPNPDGKLLKGMYAQINLSVVHEIPPLMLPSSALVVNAEGTQVAVVRDGHVHFQPIVISGDYGPNFGVSSGLAATDAVIANPSERLTEGVAVNALTVPAP